VSLEHDRLVVRRVDADAEEDVLDEVLREEEHRIASQGIA
jgi:hypothetical protein